MRSRSAKIASSRPCSLSTIAVPLPILSDLTNNGFVDFEDLTILLANWLAADAGASLGEFPQHKKRTDAVGQANPLENDANAAGDRLETILVDGPEHGQLTLNADGTFGYTPQAGFAASDEFTYRATNGTWVSNLATVTIDVESSLPADLTGNGD